MHYVRFEHLGDYEHERLQGSAVCGVLEEAYRQEVFDDSQWEFLEIIREPGGQLLGWERARDHRQPQRQSGARGGRRAGGARR